MTYKEIRDKMRSMQDEFDELIDEINMEVKQRDYLLAEASNSNNRIESLRKRLNHIDLNMNQVLETPEGRQYLKEQISIKKQPDDQ